MSEPTPRPWFIEGTKVMDEYRSRIICLFGESDQDEADAVVVVDAVNSHAGLVSALTAALARAEVAEANLIAQSEAEAKQYERAQRAESALSATVPLDQFQAVSNAALVYKRQTAEAEADYEHLRDGIIRVLGDRAFDGDEDEAELLVRNVESALSAAEQQIDKLATFIMENVPGEPSESEGAVDTAIRLLSALSAEWEQVGYVVPSADPTLYDANSTAYPWVFRSARGRPEIPADWVPIFRRVEGDKP